jgi:hypothetical protein
MLALLAYLVEPAEAYFGSPWLEVRWCYWCLDSRIVELLQCWVSIPAVRDERLRETRNSKWVNFRGFKCMYCTLTLIDAVGMSHRFLPDFEIDNGKWQYRDIVGALCSSIAVFLLLDFSSLTTLIR